MEIPSLFDGREGMMEMIVTGNMVGNILTEMRRFEKDPIIFVAMNSSRRDA